MTYAFGTKKAWKQWRDQRVDALKDPYGWFSLVELTWLGPQPQPLDQFPGQWSASKDGLTVTGTLPEGVAVYRDGQEVVGQVQVSVAPGVADRSLKDKEGRELEVFYRFGKPGVRVRDPKAPALAGDYRVSRYKFSPEWVVRGRLKPYAQPQERVVEAAVPGGSHRLTAWAEAEVALPEGGTATLTVTGDGPGSSRVLFYDQTNGQASAGWREAPVAVDGDTVVIDFNRATIFPCHLTPYGTCPKPPAENVVDTKVRAGEKKVEKP